jgi:endonuclease/exonuclease/phosphatase family metal-dependent hydrolase
MCRTTRRNSLLALLFIGGLLGGGLVSRASDPPPPLRVMTYNLRYASAEGKHAWSLRRPVMAKLLSEHAPDVIGTQEGVYRQLVDLQEDLLAYRWIGLGRDGGSRGEFMAVFYRTERLEPLEFGHYWLSDTPETIGSTTWGNANRRMVTWVRFRDRANSQQFHLVNTHFDHRIQAAREKSAQLVLERTARLETSIPVLLVGDFNAVAEQNQVYTMLVEEGPLRDAWRLASKQSDTSGTFHGFAGVVDQMPRIDWILLRGAAEVLRAEVITFNQEGRYPSDHFPVMATLRWASSQ